MTPHPRAHRAFPPLSWAVCVVTGLVLALTPRLPAQTPTGLDFPGSVAVANTPGPSPRTMRFKFENPHLNGLPIYGPGNAGVTYLWRAYPRQQNGYYTAFFWGNDDGQNNLNTFIWLPGGGADSYYGAHPYPQPPPSGAQHKWEVSVEQNDFLNGDVQYNRWHTQALRVWVDGQGRKHHEFYWNLPFTDKQHSINYLAPRSWGNRLPTVPALTWGDAPWAPGKEVWNGLLSGIQVYESCLSVADILSEATVSRSTVRGADSLWYQNLNPTPNDIADKSGRGHHPEWVGAERPRLWAAHS